MQAWMAALLPERLRSVVEQIPEPISSTLEELRIRESRPLEIGYSGTYAFVRSGGALTMRADQALIPSRDDCARLLDKLTAHSLYSFEEELKRGYITVWGGHRVGLCGKTVLDVGKVRHIRDISGFNLRIAREVTDCGATTLPYLLDEHAQSVHHTLIVSPPQQGKTTLIRDLARLISGGMSNHTALKSGLKVGIIDERSEIAACHAGVPLYDVGPRTDVMDGCPKAEGMMMMIRSMSPQVLVVDEIGREEDAAALREAMHAGIRVIATAHGQSMDDICKRPALRELVAERLFSRYVFLRKKDSIFAVHAVMDERGIPIRR